MCVCEYIYIYIYIYINIYIRIYTHIYHIWQWHRMWCHRRGHMDVYVNIYVYVNVHVYTSYIWRERYGGKESSYDVKEWWYACVCANIYIYKYICIYILYGSVTECDVTGEVICICMYIYIDFSLNSLSRHIYDI